jgi:hypothetical protein
MLIDHLKYLLLLFCMGCALGANAGQPPRVQELSSLDQQYMAQQRALVAALAANNHGPSISGNTGRDLEVLQLLLDRRLVRPDQTRELQAMGVVLGDLLAADLGMHWVVYEDAVGRSRALRYQETDSYLFPVTMISRRREADNETPVAEIYARARAIITASRPPLPFQ